MLKMRAAGLSPVGASRDSVCRVLRKGVRGGTPARKDLIMSVIHFHEVCDAAYQSHLAPWAPGWRDVAAAREAAIAEAHELRDLNRLAPLVNGLYGALRAYGEAVALNPASAVQDDLTDRVTHALEALQPYVGLAAESASETATPATAGQRS